MFTSWISITRGVWTLHKKICWAKRISVCVGTHTHKIKISSNHIP